MPVAFRRTFDPYLEGMYALFFQVDKKQLHAEICTVNYIVLAVADAGLQ